MTEKRLSEMFLHHEPVLLGGPVQLDEDTVCVKCQEKYSAIQIKDGKCFECRYSRWLSTKGREML